MILAWHGWCKYCSQKQDTAPMLLPLSKPTNLTHPLKTMNTPTNHEITVTAPASDELDDSQLEAIAGGFLDATLGSSVLGDGMLCIGGGLINSKMELNL